MRYRYPRSRTGRSDGDLAVVLHASSLLQGLDSRISLITTLARFRDEDGIAVWLTPTAIDGSLPFPLTTLPALRLDPPNSTATNDFTVVIPYETGEGKALAYNRWSDSELESVFGVGAQQETYTALLENLIGIQASEALGENLFVTLDEILLSYRDWIQDQVHVFIVTPEEALDYLDVHFKRRGVYLYAPRSRVIGKHGYYFGRLDELIHNFPQAWSATVYGEKELTGGPDIYLHMQSFYLRLLGMMEAKDIITDQYYAKADNDTLHLMLKELNSFMSLVTGTFDSLAWLCNYLYELGVSEDDENARRRISLKLRAPQSTNPVIAHLEYRNKSLATLLKASKTQKLLGIFYPARDSIQHRHPLNGLIYVWADISDGGMPSERDHEKAFGLAILDGDTEHAIRVLDESDPSDYFSRWGVRFTSRYNLLEPYKFIRQALKSLAEFYIEFFDIIGLPDHPTLSASTKRFIEETGFEGRTRYPFSIPFLASIDNPPIAKSFAVINRPVGGVVTDSGPTTMDKRSMALYGAHTMFMDFIKINRLTND